MFVSERLFACRNVLHADRKSGVGLPAAARAICGIALVLLLLRFFF